MNRLARIPLTLSKGHAMRRALPTWTTRYASTTTTTNNTSSNTPTNSTTTTSNSMKDAKERLARAALKQVPKHGWTQDAIAAAASQDPKLSISMSGMLNASELVGWFMDDMNQQLRTQKQDYDNKNENNGNSQFQAIQWRLQQVLPFVESGQWHKGMAMGLSTPLTTQSQLHEFIELVSPANSSQAYHTALGAIFVATELHLLKDSSLKYQDTWSFLQNRLDELEAHKQQFGDVDPAKFLAQLASSAPVPSLTSLANMTNSIPVVAGLAVAQSLVEGAASLVFPQSAVSTTTTVGTKASDYESPNKTN